MAEWMLESRWHFPSDTEPAVVEKMLYLSKVYRVGITDTVLDLWGFACTMQKFHFR